MTFTGADLIIHLLEQQGVRIVAGIPGGALLPLYEALGRSTKLLHILARHEQAAGFIAQGMARITQRAGVCFATSGPGVTNIITAIADAKLDSIPLVCIAGQVPQQLIGTDAFQEVPTTAMVSPVTKACFLVRDANELWDLIPEAFRIAESGRPGPVLIDVPKDVQFQRCTAPALHAAPETREQIPATATPSTNTSHFDTAWQMIEAAQRPVLYIGGGVVKARAHHLLRELAELIQAPVTTTLMALGALPTDHPLSMGMLGMHGARFTNHVIDECDLLISIGARFDDRATGRTDRFASQAQVIHIDIDPREFGKIRKPTLAIESDAGGALNELIARAHYQHRPQWLARIRALRQSHPLRTPGIEKVCSPYGIIRAVGAVAPVDAIVTTDVGQHQMWVAQAYPFQRPDRWLTSGGLGTMGFGLPAAIGAALVRPDATVICFTGDGSLLMNIQELATLSELGLKVKIVLLDNAALGLVRQQQTLFYGKRLVASQFNQPGDFVAIARAFGIPAIDLESCPAPHGTLARALHGEGPMLIRVPIAADEHVLPMVAPGKANVEALDHQEG
ncbi:acetolactate synthase-1/2/3 large subunit [Povalibacter uvarum]|uniref:Acetolactate synthase n=1 Tax=Povalibacter uvarum TaxID=732238 RepID=A0A841HK73_9GAMM|nr:biosynthetic-type acetolactate synthase large subunit [Povalibacter uvarum]MBB6093226.1 acetolactate synthase-1/2/3 large subunit [Povalibacter uvarum]